MPLNKANVILKIYVDFIIRFPYEMSTNLYHNICGSAMKPLEKFLTLKYLLEPPPVPSHKPQFPV